jgi:hypothetical protein
VRHYAQLKAGLDRGRAAAAERLKQLSVMSGTAMQVCTLTAAGLQSLAASTAVFGSCLSRHVHKMLTASTPRTDTATSMAA